MNRTGRQSGIVIRDDKEQKIVSLKIAITPYSVNVRDNIHARQQAVNKKSIPQIAERVGDFADSPLWHGNLIDNSLSKRTTIWCFLKIMTSCTIAFVKEVWEFCSEVFTGTYVSFCRYFRPSCCLSVTDVLAKLRRRRSTKTSTAAFFIMNMVTSSSD